MTDAGIDGKLYPFTFWISEEDWKRLERLACRLKISEDDVIGVVSKFYEEAADAVSKSIMRRGSCSMEVKMNE